MITQPYPPPPTANNPSPGSCSSFDAFEEGDSSSLRRMEDPTDSDRLCRICHGCEDGGEEGRLFRPCMCRGTMAWVHVECLDRWRHVSQNSSSFYQCDQCHFRYRFGKVFTAYGHGFGPDRFAVARLLSHRGAVPAASALVLLAVIFLAGFVAKACDHMWGDRLGVDAPLLSVTWADVFSCLNLRHWQVGSILVGGVSVLGFALEAVGTFCRAGRFWGPCAATRALVSPPCSCQLLPPPTPAYSATTS
jgi:hypothetical protein|eukprot:SAG25_NODE_540_length_7084_cov_4.278454_1_plen_248_part_00